MINLSSTVLINDMHIVFAKIDNVRPNLNDDSKIILKNSIFRIISYKYFWYSKESYKFCQLFISDLVIALTLLCEKDKRIFYMYLRSSIEAFYNCANMVNDQNIENDSSSYFKTKKKFKNLISTQRGFQFLDSFDTLNDSYSIISDIIHRNVATQEELAIYMDEYLKTDDFDDTKELARAIALLDTLTSIYSSFFLTSPSFKNILEDSFYRKKDLLQIIRDYRLK